MTIFHLRLKSFPLTFKLCVQKMRQNGKLSRYLVNFIKYLCSDATKESKQFFRLTDYLTIPPNSTYFSSGPRKNSGEFHRLFGKISRCRLMKFDPLDHLTQTFIILLPYHTFIFGSEILSRKFQRLTTIPLQRKNKYFKYFIHKA